MMMYDERTFERESRRITMGDYTEYWMREYSDHYELFMMVTYTGESESIGVFFKKEIENRDGSVTYDREHISTCEKDMEIYVLCPWYDKLKNLIFEFIGSTTKVEFYNFIMVNGIIDKENSPIDEEILSIIEKISNRWENDKVFRKNNTISNLTEIVWYILFEKDYREETLIKLVLIL